MTATTAAHDSNGKEWRDTTAAHLAMREPQKVAERRSIAERMMREGATARAIREATRVATGTGIGAGTLTRLRRQLEREKRRAERQATKGEPKSVAPQLTQWVRLPATTEVVTALLAAKVPFIFDGSMVQLKGGAR